MSMNTRDESELPPSAKYVLHVLDSHSEDRMTRQALQEETGLPESTLDRALESLQNEDYLVLARDPEDLRQVVLILSTTRTL